MLGPLLVKLIVKIGVRLTRVFFSVSDARKNPSTNDVYRGIKKNDDQIITLI